ncbi:MAG: DUF4091 domain-containing protein [Clostridia bacterium]|nr:DUF4091 domain-containing protein [Clostridia bacterium]
MLKTKLVSSLEKVMIQNDLSSYHELKKISALKGERISFQLLLYIEEYTYSNFVQFLPKVEGELADLVSVRQVEYVPVTYPSYGPERADSDVVSSEPGLYPDPLMPLQFHGKIRLRGKALRSLWFTMDIPEDAKAGTSKLDVMVIDDNGTRYVQTLKIDIINAILPKQETIVTQWFHVDSLAEYYRVPVYSDEHFEIIKNYISCAVKNGINLLLTPVFTPPLDTEIGGERLTCQLVKVKDKNGKYSFKYDLLDKYINIALDCGIEYFEISHLFTQWGAAHSPKVIATVDGVEKKIFGWDTDATSDEYVTFIRAFIKSFLAHMKKRGLDKKCFFHISDEPNEKQLESYNAARNSIIDLLKDYTIMDALSDFEFFSKGVVSTPIPASNRIEPFLKANVPNLWVYYCCGQCDKVSNRLINMHSWRTRSIGMQMFKYDIVGFLQWGFNFYRSMHSVHAINPWNELSGNYWVPAGDPLSVYPAEDGTAIDSLRIEVFYDALQDIRAMKLASSLVGKEKVLKKIEKEFGRSIEFYECAKCADDILKVREVVNAIIKKHTTISE